MTGEEFAVWEAAMGLYDTAASDDLRDALEQLEAERGDGHLVVGIQGPGLRLLVELAGEETPVSGKLFRGWPSGGRPCW